MGNVPPGTGPLSPDFSGIDPALLGGFVTELEHARGVIGERAEMVRRIFAANGVPAASLDPIGEAERWIDENLPELRRRHQMAGNIARLPGWNPGTPGGLLPYEEKAILPAADARRLGRQLASDYLGISDSFFNPDRDEDYRTIVYRLVEHLHDPEFTAAFFATLGPQRTLDLPTVLRNNLFALAEDATLDPPRPDDLWLRAVSLAFGTAVTGGSQVPGFAQVKNAILVPPSQDWFGASLLLSSGAFPPEWLTEAVVARGLDDPRHVNAGYLYALGNNPAAARLAIQAVTRGDPAKLRDFLTTLNKSAAGMYQEAGRGDAFGRMLAAASGAYDEEDGEHTKEAAFFAYTVMTTLGRLEVGEEVRVHLAEIAGAYATEITEGANLDDANHLLPSSFEPTESRVLGLRPVFRLSPEDTYRFISSFANTPENRNPFDEGMGDLTRHLIEESVPSTMRDGDLSRLNKTFAALGNVRGQELAAEEKFAKAADDAAEQLDKAKSFGVGTAIGIAGLAIPGMTGAVLWTALGTGMSAFDTYKSDAETESAKTEKTDREQTLGRQHIIAQSMIDAGFALQISPQDYQATCPPGVAIADGSGRLRPFRDIVQSGEDGLRALDGWLMMNTLKDKDLRTFGELTRLLADLFDGRKDVARKRALLYHR
ncbi:DUF6571 family protein [Planotetraspora mira]|uniref:DUF6571 domain-containing protein n=1 Tax=Planotetraspora mira TaxID=58121 RepID=A0A8J3TJ21_9ACTN|nr:DUF6571 family protein [Planotetraspora mira]GII27343.1 hypothetical protein Pmi06nite_07850 [Planotetraspora mira]